MHVEPMMTMEDLVRAALAHGMVPKVVAPFRDVTVGGAVRLDQASRHDLINSKLNQWCLPTHAQVLMSCISSPLAPHVASAACVVPADRGGSRVECVAQARPVP
jgi:hypothetical protein